MLTLEDQLKDLEINYHFDSDDTILCFVIVSTLSKCMFDNILTSIQRWFSNAKLKLNMDKSDYMIIRKCKIVRHGHLRQEDGDYNEEVKALGCYIDFQLTLQRHKLCWLEFISLSVLVLSSVDYCNSLYYGLPNFLENFSD